MAPRSGSIAAMPVLSEGEEDLPSKDDWRRFAAALRRGDAKRMGQSKGSRMVVAISLNDRERSTCQLY